MTLLKTYLIGAVLVVGYTLTPYKSVDYRLEPYYTKYMAKVHQHCKYGQYYDPFQIEIRLEKINQSVKPGSELGSCWKRLNRFTVTIDEQFWRTSDEASRFSVVAHELTHCLFYEKHQTTDTHFMNEAFSPLQSQTEPQLDTYLKEHCGT